MTIPTKILALGNLPDGLLLSTIGGIRGTPTKAGTYTFTAKITTPHGSDSKQFSITIKSAAQTTVAVTGVTLSKSSYMLYDTNTFTLTASVSPSNATDKTVTWASSDTSIATVDGGVVTATNPGTVKITATAGGKSASCTVYVYSSAVTKTVAVDSVSLSETNMAISAVVLPSNATNNTITWSNSNAGVATVSNGRVTATGAGTATIAATAGEKSATCRVAVAEKIKYVPKKTQAFNAIYMSCMIPA